MSDTSEKNTSELDEYGVWVKSPQESETKASEAQAPTDDLPDLSFLDDVAGMENITEEKSDATIDEEISLDEFITDGFSEPEGESASKEPQNEPAEETAAQEESNTESAEGPDFEDGEISLDEFGFTDDDESSPSQDVSQKEDGEISLDEFGFTDDSGPSKDGEISLDEFMDSDFTPPKEEGAPEEEIEEDPLDIDLDFDESAGELTAGEEDAADDTDFDALLAEQQATTEDVSQDFLGTEQEVKTDEFDVAEEEEEEESTASGEGDESIDLSEFGFVDDSDNQNPVIDTGDSEKEKEKAGPVDYEMNVDIEDESSTEEPIQEQTAEDEEINIDISTDEPLGENAVVDQSKDFNAPDDDFDLDSIMNNIEDESGNSVSFEEDKEEEKIEDTPFEKEVSPDEETFELSKEETVTEEIPDFSEEPVFEDQTELNADSGEDFEIPDFSDDTVTEETVTADETPADDTFAAEDTFSTDEALPQEDTFSIEEPFSTEETASFEEEAADSTTSGTDDSDVSINLDDFMGEEGFTDGGPGVTGELTPDYFESDESEENTGSPEPTAESNEKEEDINDFAETSEPEITEEIDLIVPRDTDDTLQEDEQKLQDFEEIDLTQKTSEPETVNNDEQKIADADAMIQDIMNQNITKRDDSEIEIEVEEPQESDDGSIEGVTLTMADFAKLDEQQVVTPENTSTDGYGADASKYMDIPDSFDEEAASLNGDSEEEITFPEQTYSVFEKKTESNKALYEEQQERKEIITHEINAGDGDVTEKEEFENSEINETPAKETSDISSNEILRQISGELAALRSEISTLKTEFNDLKNGEIIKSKEADSSLNENEPDLPIPSSGEDISEGFFSETDGDDTIALSGDELNNILNNAEFTSHDQDVYVEDTENTGLEMDFNNEKLEEPVFDENSFVEEDEEESLEEDGSVPQVDDILVESSSDDLMEKAVNTEEEVTLDEDSVPDTTLESLSKPIDLFEEDKEEETIEEGISESPVEEVFDGWNANGAEEQIADASSQIDIEEEEPIEEQNETAEPEVQAPVAQTGSASSVSDIPSDMKQEIKSVLSYMDQLLENLPEDKIAEFAQSEQFETYKKLFNELGLA